MNSLNVMPVMTVMLFSVLISRRTFTKLGEKTYLTWKAPLVLEIIQF